MGYLAIIIHRLRSAMQPAGLLSQRCKAMRLAIDQGDLDGAADIEKSLSTADRKRAEVLVLRGRLAWARGDEVAASAHFCLAMEQSPPRADAHFWQAALRMQQGQETQALEHALAAERLQPGSAEMRSLIGVIRHHQGDSPAACAAFESALKVDAGNVNAHRSLATIYLQNQDWSRAEHHFRRLLELLPEAPDILSGCASSLLGLRREAEAWLMFSRAIAIAGDNADIHRAYAVALFNEGRLAEARAQFDAGLQKKSGEPMLHVARANCDLIAHGSSAAAWVEYEWRRQLYPAHFNVRTRLWDGKAAAGRRLLVYSEQGIGDALLFSRYIRNLRDLSDEIVFQIPPSIGRLMRASALRFGWNIAEWVESAQRVEPAQVAYDREAPLLSLMHLCGFDVEKTSKPYLNVDNELVRFWSGKLGAGTPDRLRVGLVWAGNPARWEDHLRSVPTEQLAPLQMAGHAVFVSLQMDARPQYKHAPLPIPVIDPTPDIRDFADTAAIMCNLDLVLSIDTAAAHLAGALGVPCWVLLSKIPDWRWEMAGREQPWYGSHRSFRVERQQDWLPLIKRVAEALSGESRKTLSRYRSADIPGE